MPTLMPFRDYSEHDVINLYAYSGVLPVNKGKIVKVISGWLPTQNLETVGSVGAAFTNVVSQRWGVMPKCGLVTASGDVALGMLLYDVANTDENGEDYKFHPQNAAEREVAVSGAAAPIVTKGIFLYSGSDNTFTAGAAVYFQNNGDITGAGTTRIGTTLGPSEANKVLFRLNIT